MGEADADALASFDQMRRTRNRSEYGALSVSASQLEADLTHARSIVAAVRGRVKTG